MQFGTHKSNEDSFLQWRAELDFLMTVGTVAERELPSTLQSIQICRGLAASLVTLFHLGGALASPKYFGVPAYSYVFAAGGAAGVYFFFVLSGFIISIAHFDYIDRPSEFPVYLYKRFIRIFPIYWFVFLLVLIGAVMVPEASPALPGEGIIALKAALLVPQDPGIVGGSGAPVIVVAWSLQYEIIFYAIFGLFILHKVLGVSAVIFLAGWHLLGRIFSWDVPFHFLNPLLFLLFAVGLLAAWAVRTNWWPGGAFIAISISMMGFLITASMVSVNSAFPDSTMIPSDYVRLLIFGTCSGLLVFGVVTLEQQWHAPKWKPGLLVGDASYVLYLIHYSMVSVLCKFGMAAGLAGPKGAAIVGAAAVVLCPAAAVIIHIVVERPLLRFGRRQMPVRLSGISPRNARIG